MSLWICSGILQNWEGKREGFEKHYLSLVCVPLTVLRDGGKEDNLFFNYFCFLDSTSLKVGLCVE